MFHTNFILQHFRIYPCKGSFWQYFECLNTYFPYKITITFSRKENSLLDEMRILHSHGTEWNLHLILGIVSWYDGPMTYYERERETEREKECMPVLL